MRLRYALIVIAALAPLALLVIPSGTGACTPCMPNEKGERWHLVIEEWTVDGAPVEVPTTDTGYLIENPYLEDLDGDGHDLYLHAELADPASPGNASRMVLEREVAP